MRSPRSAFTLVELLVVIGIIALLIAILLPALQEARRQAQTVKCAAQMREFGNAFMMYSAENQGWWPIGQIDNYVVGSRSLPGSSGQHNSAMWWDFLYPYLMKGIKTGAPDADADPDLLRAQFYSVLWGCPGWQPSWRDSLNLVNPDATDRQRLITPGYGMNTRPTITSSYPVDGGFVPGEEIAIDDKTWSTPIPGRFFRQTQWVHASEKALVADARLRFLDIVPVTNANQLLGGPLNQEAAWGQNPPRAGETSIDYYRHGRQPAGGMADRQPGTLNYKNNVGRIRYNILYADGHVETTSDITQGYRSLRLRFPG